MRLRAVSAMCLVLLAQVLGASPARAATLVVDDDLACAGATFTTVQAAVTAASPGDTVKVCAGAYPETVTVTKTLTLRGAKAGIDARSRASTGESTISGTGGAFVVQASGVKIDGFTVKNATNAPAIHLYALYNGSTVTNNIIKNNTFGIYANSSGAGLTTINFNRFSDNNRPGSASGNGIYSDQGLTGGRIKNNLFERNQNTGMVIAQTAVPVNDVVVTTNQSVDNNSFFVTFHGTNFQVTSNVTSDTDPSDDAVQGTAIFIGGNTSGALVSGNTIKDSPWSGVAVRTSASGVTVQNNKIRRATSSGISVTSFTTGAVTIQNNNVMFGQEDGIFLSDTTSGNTITGNTSALNNLGGGAADDCTDVTLGSGTSGTANTWTTNTGAASYPPGLCSSTSSFDLSLTGGAVPSGGDPDATGTARLFLDTVTNQVCYHLTWADVDGTVDALHLHNAPAGQTGPHFVDLFNSAALSGTGSARHCVFSTAPQIAAILATPADYYVNLHSTDFPAGALRAQLA